MLSQSGKEILVKEVACTIPTYTMQRFKLPEELCEEINSALAKFWWEQHAYERKIHWVSWQNLTIRKEKGGMRSKDLSLFNISLLTKQCWRMIEDPNAYSAQIMEAKKGERHHGLG